MAVTGLGPTCADSVEPRDSNLSPCMPFSARPSAEVRICLIPAQICPSVNAEIRRRAPVGALDQVRVERRTWQAGPAALSLLRLPAT